MKTVRKPTKTEIMSDNEPPDRRLAKTRNSLARALFVLMQKSNWEDISVQDICDQADVARSSFYTHYGSKIALLDHTIENSLAQSRDHRKTKIGHLGMLDWIIDHVTADRIFFNRIARSQGAQVVMHRFKSALCAELSHELKSTNPNNSSLLAHYILGGLFDALTAWSTTWKTNQLPLVKAEILEISNRIAISPARLKV